jgi:transposase-like protein
MVACKKREQAVSEKKRKNFSGQFKAKVALEAIRGVKTANEIAQEFGVHPTQVGLWKKELQERAAGLFGARRGPKPVGQPASPEAGLLRDWEAENGTGLA